MDCPVSEIRSLARLKARTPGLRFGGVSIALIACCGCQLIGRERPVPKQMAASRQLSQRGISALERCEWDKGETLLSQAIKACPTDAEPHRHYAEALWHRGAGEEALSQMREAMRLSGEDPNLAVRAGEMCLELGRTDEAAKLAEDAIDLCPHSGTAWGLRGEVAQSRGQLDEALADAHRGLEYQHDDKKLLLLTAEIYRQQGRPERALGVLESLRDCYASGEEPQRVLYLQGLAFAALARYDDAVEVYSLAIERDRSSAELYYRLAEVQLRAGRPSQASGAIQQAIALDPGHVPSRALAPQVELALRDASSGLRK
jgi:tetratricopeptide (TPR) repeat protein